MTTDIVQDYFNLQNDVYNFFDYENEWRAYPLDDCTDDYWLIYSDSILWSPEPLTEESIEKGTIIYTGLLHRDKIYRKDNYSMLVVDTQCDGNIFLMIFNNDKESKDEKLIECADNNC